MGGAGSDLGNITAGFTATSLFICFVNPWYLCRLDPAIRLLDLLVIKSP